MKVLLLNDYGTPTGGAELSIINLRDGLRARGQRESAKRGTQESDLLQAGHVLFS